MTRLTLPLALAAFAVGCGSTPDPGPADDTDPTPDPCANAPQLMGVSPEPGDESLYTDTVEATWDAVPESPMLIVTDADGAAIPGQITDDDNGRTLRFTADEIFTASSTVNVEVTWVCLEESAVWSFGTGPYGETLDDPNELIDRVLLIDLGSADIVEPAGVGPLLEGFVTDVYVLFHLMDVSDFTQDELHVMGAIGELVGGDVVQDVCSETIPLTFGQDAELGTADDLPARWDDPWLRIGPTDLTLDVQGTVATVNDLNLEMLFHPEATDFVGGRLAGRIDTRQLISLVDSEDPNAICALAEKVVGVGCIDCGDGEPYCLSLVAENIQGAMLWDGGLTPITADDIDNNAACQ